MGEVTIIGAGGVGTAAAADLTLAGHEVLLYELPQFSQYIDPIIKSGGIRLAEGEKEEFAEISKATMDIAEAVKGAKIIMVATVGWAHKTVAELCAPHLEDGQTVILIAAQLGSLEFKKVLEEKKPGLKVIIAETTSAPYAARREATEKAEVVIRSRMRDWGLASLPGKYTQQVMNDIKAFYPDTFFPVKNVVEVGLSNPNILIHPAPTLLMSSWIETQGSNFFYASFTPSVLRVVEASFREKNAILNTLGLKDYYSFEQFEKLIEDPGLHKIKGPADMHHRYITEDCPMGLVALTAFGDLLGVPTPVCKATITFISQIIGTDYFKEGRNLERLGISGLNPDQLQKLLDEG